MRGSLNCTSPSPKRMTLFWMFQDKYHILKHKTVFQFRENSNRHLLFVYTKLPVHYQNKERNLKVSYRVFVLQKTFNVLRFYHFIISVSFITTSFLQLSHSLFLAPSLSYLPCILVYVNWNDLRVDHKPSKLIYTVSLTSFLNLSIIC